MLRPEAAHRRTRSEYRSERDEIKIEKLLKLYNRYYLQEKDEILSGQNNPIRKHWKTNRGKLIKLKQESDFLTFSAED